MGYKLTRLNAACRFIALTSPNYEKDDDANDFFRKGRNDGTISGADFDVAYKFAEQACLNAYRKRICFHDCYEKENCAVLDKELGIDAP